MSQTKTKNKLTTFSFQKKPLEVAVGAALIALCSGAQAQAVQFNSGVELQRLDHELVNFTITTTTNHGIVDTVNGGAAGSGGAASSASSGENGQNGQVGARGTNAGSSAGSKSFERIHTPETTTNSALVSVNTISNSLSPITGILLEAKVVPDSGVSNSTINISADTTAYGGVGGAGGPGGAGDTLDNSYGGTGGVGGIGGSATGAAVSVDADMRRIFNSNAAVSDNSVTNSSLGVISTGSGNSRAGIGLQALSNVDMTTTTNVAANTYAYGGAGGNGGVGGSGGSVVITSGSLNGSRGGDGGPGGRGGDATAGAATATSDSRAIVNLQSTVTNNLVTNNGRVTADQNAIGLQALSYATAKALAIAVANSDATDGPARNATGGSIDGANGIGGTTTNIRGTGGPGGAGGIATVGAVRANADAQASASALATLSDNQVVNAGIMTSLNSAGISLLGDARSDATASSVAITSQGTSNYAKPGTYQATHVPTPTTSVSGGSAFNHLAGQAISSVMRNSVSNSGQILADTDGVAVVSSAYTTLKTSNEVYTLASSYSSALVPTDVLVYDPLTVVNPLTSYQYSNGNSLASATNQANSVTNTGAGALIASEVGIKIWSDADSLVNQANSGLTDYDFVRGNSQALSSTRSNQINSQGTVLVDIPFGNNTGLGLSARASSTNSTNIGGIDPVQKATALNDSNLISNSGSLVVRSSIRDNGTSSIRSAGDLTPITGNASTAATALMGIDVSADATNTGRSKITTDTPSNLSSTWGAASGESLPDFANLSTSARVNSNSVTNTGSIAVDPVARTSVTGTGINFSAAAVSNPNRFLESTYTSSQPVLVEGVRTTLDSNDVISSGTIAVGGLNAYGVRMVSDATMNNPNSGGLTLSISSATANSNNVTLSGTVGVGSAASSLAAGTTINANSTSAITDSARSGNVSDLYVDSASSSNIYSSAGAITVQAAAGSGVAQGLGIAATSTLNFGESQSTSDLFVNAAASSNQVTQSGGGSLSVSGLDSSFAYQIAANSIASGSGAVSLNGTLADRIYANANSNMISIAGQTSVVSNNPRGIEVASTATFNVDGSVTNNSGDVQAKVNSNSVTHSGVMSLTAASSATTHFAYGVNLSALAQDTSSNGLSSTTTTLSEVNSSTINNSGTLSLFGGYDNSTNSTTIGNSSKSVGIRLSATSNLGNGNNSAAYVGSENVALGNVITNSGSINVASGSGIALLATATATSGDNSLNISNVGSTLSAFADVSNNTINNTGRIIVSGVGDADAINFEARATATSGNAGTRFLSNTITSSGRIETPDDAINMDGVTFASANTITNTGTIIAGDDFVDLGGTTATYNTVRNSGTVTAADDFVQIQGLTLTSNTVINSGSVTVGDDFLQMDNGGSAATSITGTTVENSGRVVAFDFGIQMNATSAISNNIITNSGQMFSADTSRATGTPSLIRLDGDTTATVENNIVTNSGFGFSGGYGIYIDSAATGGIVSGNTITNSGRLISKADGIKLDGHTLEGNTINISGVQVVDSGLSLIGSNLTRSNQQTWVYGDLGNAIQLNGNNSSPSNTLNIQAPAYLAGRIQLNNTNTNVNLTSGLSHSTRWAIGEDGASYNDQVSSYTWSGGNSTHASLSGLVPWFVNEGFTDARTNQRYDVYATIDPTAFTAAVNQVADLSGSVSAMMNQGMVANSDKTHSLWIGAIGHRLDYDGDRRAVNDYKTSLGSYALGYTYRYNPDWLLGAMIGSTDSTLRVSSRYADLYGTSYDNKANGEFLSLNAGTKLYGFDVNLGISGGSQRHEDRRFVNDNLEWWGVSYAQSKYTSNWLAPEITLAYPWTIETGLVLKPSVNVRYTNQKIGGYTETGSSSNATVQARTLGITDTTVGLDLTKTYGKSSLTGRVSYISRSSDEQDMVRVTMLGDTRNVSSFYRNFDAVRAGFIWKLNLANDLDLFVNANYLSGSNVKGADGNVALRLQF